MCRAQGIDMGTRMRIPFQERYNLQHGIMSRAIRVERAQNNGFFKLDHSYIKKQGHVLRVTLKAATSESEVITILSHFHS